MRDEPHLIFSLVKNRRAFVVLDIHFTVALIFLQVYHPGIDMENSRYAFDRLELVYIVNYWAIRNEKSMFHVKQ